MGDAYDLYFFIFGVYRLVSGGRHDCAHGISRNDAQKYAPIMDMLPTRARTRIHRGTLFNLRLYLRRTNPLLLCCLNY